MPYINCEPPPGCVPCWACVGSGQNPISGGKCKCCDGFGYTKGNYCDCGEELVNRGGEYFCPPCDGIPRFSE